jgi:hypothetical protein
MEVLIDDSWELLTQHIFEELYRKHKFDVKDARVKLVNWDGDGNVELTFPVEPVVKYKLRGSGLPEYYDTPTTRIIETHFLRKKHFEGVDVDRTFIKDLICLVNNAGYQISEWYGEIASKIEREKAESCGIEILVGGEWTWLSMKTYCELHLKNCLPIQSDRLWKDYPTLSFDNQGDVYLHMSRGEDGKYAIRCDKPFNCHEPQIWDQVRSFFHNRIKGSDGLDESKIDLKFISRVIYTCKLVVMRGVREVKRSYS